MLKISVFSEDVLYAGMLMNEIRSTLGTLPREIKFSMNEIDTDVASRSSTVAIVDLDGKYANVGHGLQCVIGISSDEDALSSRKYSFCRRIFIRPFLIDEFLFFVVEACRAFYENAPLVKKGERTNEISLELEGENNISFCGNRLHLSKNEYEILSLLKAREADCVTRAEINCVLGGECGNMCDVYICRLRGKLSEICKEKLIYTVRNKGYTLKLK